MTFNEARKAAGLTQEGLARQLNVSWKTVARYCDGSYSPKGQRALDVREAFAKRGVEWGPGVCPCCGRAL